MAASIEQFINSPAGLRIAHSISRVTTPKVGYIIANLAAKAIVSLRHSAPVRAVRANQWVIAGEKGSPQYLDQAVQEVFQYSARSIYELYHCLQQPAVLGQMFTIDPSFQAVFERREFDQRGLMVAGLHMAGFDLGLQWLCLSGFKPLVLTLPDPEGGRRLEYDTRRKTGVNLVPTSFTGMRQAFHHLQHGGMVLTGVDRPVTEGELCPRFFGRPSALPTHYVSLALKTQVPIVVIATRLDADGRYHIHASPVIEPGSFSTEEGNLLSVTENVLSVIEGFIRKTPRQWLISLPVWPDIMSAVPGQFR